MMESTNETIVCKHRSNINNNIFESIMKNVDDKPKNNGHLSTADKVGDNQKNDQLHISKEWTKILDQAELAGDWSIVFANLKTEQDLESFKDIFLYLKSKLDDLPDDEKRSWIRSKITEAFKDQLPESLIEISIANFFPGDSGASIDSKPSWLDLEKFKRGQKFARDNLFPISYADMLSLLSVFSFEDGLRTLISTGASSTPYTAFKRYFSTLQRVRNWYNSDPWTPGTPAYEDIKIVRRMHALVRRRMGSMSPEDRETKTKISSPWCPGLEALRADCRAACPAPPATQCLYVPLAKYPELKFEQLNQSEMSSTQFAFVGLIVTYPKFFGLHHVSDYDIEAFCHVWQGLGYLLGVEDEFNFCRGSLEDVRKRTRNFMEYWVKPNMRIITPEWEHMVRCVVEGTQYYFPGVTYGICVMDLAQILELDLPKFYSQMSYIERARWAATRFYFEHACKLPAFHAMMHYRMKQVIEKAKKYDESKHKELQRKSAKTLQSYALKSKKNNQPTEKYSVIDFNV